MELLTWGVRENDRIEWFQYCDEIEALIKKPMRIIIDGLVESPSEDNSKKVGEHIDALYYLFQRWEKLDKEISEHNQAVARGLAEAAKQD